MNDVRSEVKTNIFQIDAHYSRGYRATHVATIFATHVLKSEKRYAGYTCVFCQDSRKECTQTSPTAIPAILLFTLGGLMVSCPPPEKKK